MRVLPLLLALILAAPTMAQPSAVLSDSAQVSLLTMLPGQEVYSRFGHSAFRIRDPATGLDKTYNYGTFDFEQPYFVLRFARGQLDYMIDTAPYDYEVAKYDFLRRPMIEQRLALGPETARTLYRLLETNALPQNREYRYDFYFDNCSTRLLAILDSALVQSGRPPVTLADLPQTKTFRELSHDHVSGDPLLAWGIDLGLGLPTDRVATPREATFLPTELMHRLDGASVGGAPLVVETDTVVAVPGYEGNRAAFDWPLLVTALLALLGALATAWGWQRSRIASRTGRIGDVLLFGVAGFAGLVLAFLWFGTEHAVTGPNLNLLWAWPTHLVAAWALARQRTPRWLRAYLLATGGVTLFTTLFWPFLPQALPIAAWPLAALLAVRSFVRALPTTIAS